MEKKSFDLMMARYEAFVQKVELLKHKANGKRLEKWLTGHEVCQQLRISPRTLQKLRDRRFLGHTQLGRQFYYKPEEVKALIPLISRIKTTKWISDSSNKKSPKAKPYDFTLGEHYLSWCDYTITI